MRDEIRTEGMILTGNAVTQCDRTRSLARFSSKREYWRRRAEIFGRMGRRMIKLGTRRLSASCKMPANGGLPREIVGKISRARTGWLGRQDSNLGMAESKSAALPLGYAPTSTGEPLRSDFACGGRTIPAWTCPINVHAAHIYICGKACVDRPQAAARLAGHELPRPD